MRLAYLAAQAVFLSQSTTIDASSSFLQDNKSVQKPRKAAMEQALLAKATPLDEYKAMLRERGYDVGRQLDQAAGDDYNYQYQYQYEQNDDNEEEEEEEQQQDNENQGYGNYGYNFDAYSLKYAKCQPVQRFSEESIEAGEYSPMIVDDIVILRLCPSRFCSVSKQFGCHYNYADYAIGLSDYVAIMLSYKVDKSEQLCEWCEGCYGGGGRRQLDDTGNGDDDASQWWNYANNGDDDYSYNDPCANYESYCTDEYGDSVCDEDNNGDDNYLGIEDYFDYLNCVHIKDEQDYSYFVQPRCDGESQTITMGVFYDEFCSQYAGNEASLNNMGLSFREGFFEDIYSTSTCIDCAESETAPGFYANSALCGSVHVSGAKCTTNLQYDLSDGDSATESALECAFIDNIRNGVYDEKGQLGGNYSYGGERSVTTGQKWGLALSIALCGILALYSCYLHHSITNLLIKSLSHTDLLPPSRRSGRGRSSRDRRTSSRRESYRSDRDHGDRSNSRSGSARRTRYGDDGDADWEHVPEGVVA